MATSFKGCSLSDRRLNEIHELANNWVLGHGISMKADGDDTGKLKMCPAPYALFPSVVPQPVLDQVKATMTHFNRLMHAVAMNHDFLSKTLKNVFEVDPFMMNLWNIYNRVRDEGIKQPLMLGLFRNDFMMNCREKCITPDHICSPEGVEMKQIEFNTIAASFGGLTQNMSSLHRLTMGMAGMPFSDAQIPDNSPASGLALGMVKAWELYGNPDAAIVFVVSQAERNIMDQRWLEFEILKLNPKIRVLRRGLLDFEARGMLDSESKLLIDDYEVAILYLRDGYTNENYSSQKEWDGRLKMELSKAVKCPSVQYQLAGAKKIQQELARPGALEQFVSDLAIIDLLRKTFADQYSMDLGEEGDKAVALALKFPDKFVLKPQREGGGHNLYKDDITKFIEEHKDSKERNAYILMQRIFPWEQRNYLVKTGVPFALSTIISEIGIYGVYIGTTDLEEKENCECGHMMRTKVQGVDEGGIVAGFSVLDSPFFPSL